MNKKDLLNSLLKVLSTRKEAHDAIETVFGEIKKAVNRDEKVVISGFGSFHPYTAKSTKARNPNTGETVYVSPKKKLKFHKSKDLFK